ncbi:hypothetical protein JHK82_045157 [Glycine max]|uniref:Anaphase-promoting complex subunit 4 WD40 domain-containing protein n=2 Tax=Glycine subgen. Soja TaxID=1462606 RepID=K7MHI3_SOYBN|nr:cell division cycle 20.1, cofactor of APC complex [Glycine max]XP_028206829.1 cell division cycle 20.1, cofactor of APC complex-like [Glycine soja]KAG4939435.1 hypothetical protein JHK86_045576 [Glycine max]KAG4952288.1 hypothetical protein JHK85_046155 [Glycine max]KAG5100105.1 hypothetical protein JHK82_045157 [Glycine max]KRH08491.1 hypothetical protein GLYMA_16G153100v4 [Glycine max]RZB61196.1 Cell division cycle 20.1, cofactor of APC complex [Glycine soja]|eukprot:XP_006599438.1 cell division cycle 20.1, cofactor of APC complex [Glycine max]
MDAGPLSFSPIIETRSRYPFQQQFQKKSSKGNCEHHQLDRFIPPNRSAMDFDYAHYLCLLRGTKISTLIRQNKPAKPRRVIPQTLDAPELVDDYYLNLWGSNNCSCIALGSIMYFWDAKNHSTSELVTIDDEDDPVTFVS